MIINPRPNHSNTSTQHISTLLAEHLQAPARQSHLLKAIDRNIVGRNMLQAFGHPVATFCDMLRVENRASVHAQEQHCCANQVKHRATSTNVAWKIWPFSNFEPTTNLSQHAATCCNKSQPDGKTHATCCTQQCCDRSRWNVVIVWPGLYIDL